MKLKKLLRQLVVNVNALEHWDQRYTEKDVGPIISHLRKSRLKSAKPLADLVIALTSSHCPKRACDGFRSQVNTDLIPFLPLWKDIWPTFEDTTKWPICFLERRVCDWDLHLVDQLEQGGAAQLHSFLSLYGGGLHVGGLKHFSRRNISFIIENSVGATYLGELSLFPGECEALIPKGSNLKLITKCIGSEIVGVVQNRQSKDALGKVVEYSDNNRIYYYIEEVGL